MFDKLASELAKNRVISPDGCMDTVYENIRGLNLLASSTNGTSGIGIYQKRRVYWTQRYSIAKGYYFHVELTR